VAKKTAGFSGATLAIPNVRPELTEMIVAHSRQLYARDKASVEQVILTNTFSNLQKPAAAPQSPPKGSGGPKILAKLPGISVTTTSEPAKAADAAEPAKKRRRRRKNDKSNEDSTKYEQKTTETKPAESKPVNQEFEIKLR
jgi:hypothetical protein